MKSRNSSVGSLLLLKEEKGQKRGKRSGQKEEKHDNKIENIEEGEE